MATPTLTLKPELALHAIRKTDVPEIVKLENLCADYDIGLSPVTSEENVYAVWDLPGLNIEQNAWIVRHTTTNEIVAFGLCFGISPFTRLSFEIAVHPDYRQDGITEYLFEICRNNAQKFIPLAPEGTRVAISSAARNNNQWWRAFLQSNGFEITRYFWKMSIDLVAEPAQPKWPEGISLRPYEPENHSHALHAALNEAFSDHWGFVPVDYDRWHYLIINHPQYDPALIFLAFAGDEIAGFSICLSGMTSEPDTGFIGELAVRRPWRRLGLAQALLQQSFGAFYRIGKNKAALYVDSASLTGATRLYEKVGMHVTEENLRYELEIRVGEEIGVQSLSD